MIYITCFHTVERFQVFLYNTNNSIQNQSFCPSLNISVLSNDRTLISTDTPGQRGFKRIGNEWVLHIPQSCRNQDSQSDGLVLYPGHLLALGYYWDVIGVFDCPSRLSWKRKSMKREEEIKKQTNEKQLEPFSIRKKKHWS